MAQVRRNPDNGPLQVWRLADFERRLGVSVPEQYREFLLASNGGKPEPHHCKIGSGDTSDVRSLRGLHNRSIDSLDSVWEQYQERVPPLPVHLVAIADDSGGNEWCIGLTGSDRGRIFFWDHESGEVIEVAESFQAFLDGLFEWINPNEHSFWRMCRTRNRDDVETFLVSGLDVDTVDDFGRTLLENAAIFGWDEAIVRLHVAGASLREARSYAEHNEHHDTLRLLDRLASRSG